MSLRTPQLRELTNQVPSPRASTGRGVPAPCMSNQCERGPRLAAPKVRAWVAAGQGSPCALRSPSSVDIVPPSPTWEHFLRASVISWESQDGEGTLQHPEATALRGKLFAHRLYSLFVSAPRPLPLRLKLLPTGPSPSPDLHRVLFPAPRGAHGAAGPCWGETASSLILFSPCEASAPPAAPTAAETGHPHCAPWGASAVTPRDAPSPKAIRGRAA